MADEAAVLDAPSIYTTTEDASHDEATTLGETPEVDDEQTEDADTTEGDESGEGDETDQEEVEGDGKETQQNGQKLPGAVKKALASIKATDPKTAKILKSTYFENQEYKANVGTPAEAVALKQQFDEIGGKEGLQSIAAEREEWHSIDAAFAEGKPDFVKGLADGNPEAFLKTAPHVINEFAQRAPEQYAYYANMVALNTVMNQPGMPDSLNKLADLHNQLGEAPWAQKAIADVVNGISGLQGKAQVYEQRRTDPAAEKLQRDRSEFENHRRATLETDVSNRAEAALKEKMQPEIERIIGARKVDAEAMKGYQEMVQNKAEKMLGQIPGFASQYEAFLRLGDAQGAADFVASKYARILPEAAKVIAPFLRNIPSATQARKPAAGQPAQRAVGPGEVTLREMPEWNQIDFTRCTTADVMSGKAVLTNGKRASGWV